MRVLEPPCIPLCRKYFNKGLGKRILEPPYTPLCRVSFIVKTKLWYMRVLEPPYTPLHISGPVDNANTA